MNNDFTTLKSSDYTTYVSKRYFMAISNSQVNTYQLYMGLSSRDLTSLSKEEIIEDCKNVSNLISSIDKTGIYVVPIIPLAELEQAALENDGRAYANIMIRYVTPIINSIIQNLNRKNKGVVPKVKMVKQNDMDRKIVSGIVLEAINQSNGKPVDWLEEVESENLKQSTFISNAPADNPPLEKKNEDIAVDFSSENAPTKNGGIAPIDRQYENTLTHEKNKGYTRKLVKPQGTPQPRSYGFSSMKFIIMTLVTSIVLGLSIAFLLLK